MKLQELHDQVIECVKRGEFAQGIERFYADDVTQQENSGSVTKGRDVLAKAEYEYQGKVTNLEKVEVLATGIDDRGDGNGTVLYEVHMIWDHSELGHVDIQQTVVERWKNGKIESFRYYGDFA